jgi:hypothetical protein
LARALVEIRGGDWIAGRSGPELGRRLGSALARIGAILSRLRPAAEKQGSLPSCGSVAAGASEPARPLRAELVNRTYRGQ